MPEFALAAQAALYTAAVILLGHLLHELLHVTVALLSGCEDVQVNWPHVTCRGGPLQRLSVAAAPLVAGVPATVAYVLTGPWWLAVGTLTIPHPAWFGLAALTLTGRDDVVAVWRSSKDVWFVAKLAWRARQLR